MIVGRRFSSLEEVPEGVLTVDMNGELSIGLVGGRYRVSWDALADNEEPGIPLDYLMSANERKDHRGYVEIKLDRNDEVVGAEVVGMTEPTSWQRIEDVPVNTLVRDSDGIVPWYYIRRPTGFVECGSAADWDRDPRVSARGRRSIEHLPQGVSPYVEVIE